MHFEGKWHSNVEMNQAANQLGNALKGLGIKKGTVWAFSCSTVRNSYRHISLFSISALYWCH